MPNFLHHAGLAVFALGVSLAGFGNAQTTTCNNVLIDDFYSQSRLTFLYYNAMLQPSSDDATMKSVVVGTPSTNRVTLTPVDDSSYFYSQFDCFNANTTYGGISLRIKAPSGTTFSIELDSTSECGGNATATPTVSTTDLGWSFDGTEKLYSIPFSKFDGLNTDQIATVVFGGFNNAVVFGPMGFYCGSTPSEVVVTPPTSEPEPTATEPAPAGTASAVVIDTFSNSDANDLGFWHGYDDGMSVTWGTKKVTLQSSDADYSFYTQVSGSCSNYASYESDYLHISYTGTTAFSISLQQHNQACNESAMPYPETWDSVEASRYASDTDIYVPLSHFNVNLTRVIGFAIGGFYKTDSVTFTKFEIVKSVPSGWTVETKLPTGNLVFACKRPNSFAFAIDDGDPVYAQQVMQTVKEAGIKVTFFTVGLPLLDPSTNLSSVYNEMLSEGHQIALHSYTHPKMEGLPDDASIDWEYDNDINAVAETFNGMHTPYFRPPFGTTGARMRQRLAVALNTTEPYIVNWSVDVEDWLWAETDTPEKQLESFQRDVNAGGNLVVMHYLYPSTVSYLSQFIEIAKATGKDLMRVDQCMEDPNAPAF